MYEDFEIKTSYKYLKEVISSLEEPICMLGGWAVFFHVNEKFQNSQGRPYLGSRDIDLGFHISEKDLEKTALSQSLKILIEKLKFRKLSFRLYKEVHTETEEEIKKGETIPRHFIFPIYVDPVVDNVPKNFKQHFGFSPIDEPLLKYVFENEEAEEIKGFGKKLLLPKPELLVAMKLNSLKSRDKQHKKIKDICDIFALLWYSNIELEKINLSRFISKKRIQNSISIITEEDLQKAGEQLSHRPEEIRRVLAKINHD